MAGSAPQYRKRVTMWTECRTLTRLVARDARFFYIEHILLDGDTPAAHVMSRTVVTSCRRMVPPDEVMLELGRPDWNPRRSPIGWRPGARGGASALAAEKPHEPSFPRLKNL